MRELILNLIAMGFGIFILYYFARIIWELIKVKENRQ